VVAVPSNRIRDARVRAGLSQSELARAVGVHESYVSHVERGARTFAPETLARVAEVLGVPAEYLKEGADAPAYRAAEAALVDARRLSRSGHPAAAAEALAAVDVTDLDVDTASRVGLAHAEALDVAGRIEQSADRFAEVADRLIAAGRYARAAYAGMRVVMALVEAGDLGGALERGEQYVEALSPHVEGSDELVRLESTLMWAYIARGDAIYARYRGRRLLDSARRRSSPRAVAAVHWNLAFAHDALDEPEAALDQLDAARELVRGDDPGRDMPRLGLDRAQLLVALRPPRAAEALAELDAARLALEVGESTVERARAATIRSQAYLLLGNEPAAREHAGRAVALLRSGVRRDAAAAHEALGDVLLSGGSSTEAVKEFRTAADLLDLISSGRAAATLWRRVGDRLRDAGDDDEHVADAYGRALSAAGIRGRLPVPPTLPGRVPTGDEPEESAS
jgi:tetratricopeptide (TPR) repeat protein